MKALLAAAMAVALLAAPALAQDLSAGGRGKGGHRSDQTDTRKKGDDKGYNAALAKMPDKNQKLDPWRGVRPEGTNQTGR